MGEEEEGRVKINIYPPSPLSFPAKRDPAAGEGGKKSFFPFGGFVEGGKS